MIIVAVVVLAACALTARQFVWPGLPPLPPKADAIVQLGGPGDRRLVAFDLWRQGRAPVVAISVSDDEYSTTWCGNGVYHGVPVICFHSEPFTTRGEAREIGGLAARHGWHSVILVTTPDQAKRAELRVSRCFAGDISVATARLPLIQWPWQVVYQWGATLKAYTLETTC
ncbi:MAG TPA: hypothetical protein VGD29_33620 [Actinoplanes sp.]|jgi:uncharacterized SAM-binding protein YcdF (DUF218 family)